MKDFAKGDTVRHTQWAHLTDRIVEAISDDGKHLWLRDDDGDLETRNNSGMWEKVEPFFEDQKRYISNSSGREYLVLSVDTSPKGVKYAVMESVHSVGFLVLQQHHFKGFDAL